MVSISPCFFVASFVFWSKMLLHAYTYTHTIGKKGGNTTRRSQNTVIFFVQETRRFCLSIYVPCLLVLVGRDSLWSLAASNRFYPQLQSFTVLLKCRKERKFKSLHQVLYELVRDCKVLLLFCLRCRAVDGLKGDCSIL